MVLKPVTARYWFGSVVLDEKPGNWTDGIKVHTYMLFAGREVRIGKNRGRGLEYGPRPQAEGLSQDRGHRFSQYGPT